MSTTTIYRLEDEDHQGPYTGDCVIYLGDNIIQHPTPDDENPTIVIYDEDRCGFSTLGQFHAWFDDDMLEELEFHGLNCDCNWYLSTYEVDSSMVRELLKQTLFNHSTATFVNRTPVHDVTRSKTFV